MAEETQTLILDIQFDSAQAVKEATDLKNRIADLRKENKALIESEGQVTDAYTKNEIEIKALTKELNSHQAALVKQSQANNSAKGSNDQLRATLSVLTAQYNALSKEERDNSVAGQVLGKTIKNISDELKASEGAVGDFRRNVGDYEGAANRASNSLEAMKARLQELNKTVQTSDVGSKQFKDAQDEAGKLGLQIGQLEGKLDEFGNKEPKNPAKKSFEDTVAAAGAAGSAIQLTTLLTEDNSQANEALNKSVRALAIGQQIANIVKEKGALIDSASALSTGAAATAQVAYSAAVGTSTGLLKLFRLALIGTGIGAIIVALGFLIANFEAVSNAVKDFLGLSSEQERASEALKKSYQKQSDQLGLLISLEERRIGIVSNAYQRQIELAKAQGKDTTNLEKLKEEAFQKTTNQMISQLQAQLALAKGAKVSAKEQIDLQKQIQDLQGQVADSVNAIEVARLAKIKEQKDAAIKAAEEQTSKNKAELEKRKADQERLAEIEKKNQADLSNARIALLEDGLNKEILLIRKAQQEKIDAVQGDSETANALRLTLTQQAEQQIAAVQQKYADEKKQRDQDVYDNEVRLASERAAKELADNQAREQAIVDRVNFEIAQTQLGIAAEDTKFVKTIEDLQNLAMVQEATGQTRQEIDQAYYDFVEKEGQISFDKFLELQAQQVAATTAANEQMIQSYAAFGSQVGDLLAKQLSETGADLKGFARQFLVLILDTVQKQVTAAVLESSIKSIAQYGPVAGAIRAGVSIAAINTAFGLAKAKLSQPPQGFATGVVGLQGAGTSTSDSIPAMLSRGESVITADGTRFAQQAMPGLLEALNSRNKFATGVVDFGAGSSVADFSGISLIAEAISKMQPVVRVSDINKKQADYNEVRTTGTL